MLTRNAGMFNYNPGAGKMRVALGGPCYHEVGSEEALGAGLRRRTCDVPAQAVGTKFECGFPRWCRVRHFVMHGMDASAIRYRVIDTDQKPSRDA
jgi:hypothetical protein